MPGWHLQSHLSPITLGGFEFGPHGLGSQGSTITASVTGINAELI